MSFLDMIGHRSVARWRTGDLEGAAEDVARTVAILGESVFPAYTALPGQAAAAQTAAALWESDPSDRSHARLFRALSRSLLSLSRSSPIAKSEAQLWKGVWLWRRGRRAAARRAWAKALNAALSIGLPATEAAVYDWSGRLDPDAPTDYVGKAVRLYGELGYTWDAQRLETYDRP